MTTASIVHLSFIQPGQLVLKSLLPYTGEDDAASRAHTRSAGTLPQSLLSSVLELGHRRDMAHLQASGSPLE